MHITIQLPEIRRNRRTFWCERSQEAATFLDKDTAAMSMALSHPRDPDQATDAFQTDGPFSRFHHLSATIFKQGSHSPDIGNSLYICPQRQTYKPVGSSRTAHPSLHIRHKEVNTCAPTVQRQGTTIHSPKCKTLLHSDQ